MKIGIRMSGLGLLCGMFACVAVYAAEAPWVTRSNENARVLLQILAKYSPETASQLGVDGFDEAIVDLSHDQFDAQQADLGAAVSEFRQRATGEADARVRQDLQILVGAGADNVSSNAVNRKYLLPFIDVTELMFGVVQQMLDPRVPVARQQTIAVRLAKYAGLSKGYQPITELAKARTLERVHADASLMGPYRGEVEQAIGDLPTYLTGIKELLAKSKFKGWQRSYASLEKQLTDYTAWLKSDLLPRARADHRLPPEVYADNLHQFGVDVPPEELIAKAMTSFAEIRNQMAITAGLIAKERGLPDADYHAVIRKLKEQQIPADQVLALYKARLGEIENAIRTQHIVSLPDRAASIRVATPAENAQQPAPHMSPPRLIGNTGEYGEFVLATGVTPSRGLHARCRFVDAHGSRGASRSRAAIRKDGGVRGVHGACRICLQ